MKKAYLLSLLLLLFVSAESQTKFKHFVRIKPKHCILELRDTLDRVDTCKVDAGSIVKTEKVIKTKCCDSTITKIDTVTKTFFLYDSIKKKYPRLIDTSYWNNANPDRNIFGRIKPVKANVTISKDSLLVNFWLFTRRKSNTCTLNESTDAMFHSSSKYYIQLQNRQYASFGFRNWEIGALTIPIKIRPGFTTADNIKIPSTATSNVANIGTYFAYKFGKVKYWYNKYEDIKTSNSSFAVGAFFGISNDKLDSLGTIKAGVNGLKKNDTSIDIVSLSYGVTALFDVSDFRFGIMIGVDRAFGDNRKLWNFDKKIWFGVGVGYKLAFIRNPQQ